ncbi:MAG TPA: hypothetical protein VMY42_15265 [Thermoguttaceae bacterium]|nr:hypothetical protein [Thermoguttaceae bacterium]
MIETLQEFVDSRGVRMRADRQSGVIRGVKILGINSRNGRTYLPEAISQAAGLYENAKVNVNHPKGNPSGPRDYQDRIGSIRDVRLRAGEGLFADFHFNPRHALAEQLVWDAEHAPENVGFSHNVQARTSRRGDQVVVEAITKVQSVDLVADPATTGGLFESDPPGKGSDAAIAKPSLDDLKRDYPELVESIRRERDAELDELRAEVERLTAQEAARQKHLLVGRLLREFDLPDPETGDAQAESIVGRRFLESVLAAPDEETMRDLIEERARLVKSLGRTQPPRDAAGGRPLSRDRHLVDAAGRFDARAFVEAIT